MKESIFLDYVGDNSRMRILQYLIEGRDFDYTILENLNSIKDEKLEIASED